LNVVNSPAVVRDNGKTVAKTINLVFNILN